MLGSQKHLHPILNHTQRKCSFESTVTSSHPLPNERSPNLVTQDRTARAHELDTRQSLVKPSASDMCSRCVSFLTRLVTQPCISRGWGVGVKLTLPPLLSVPRSLPALRTCTSRAPFLQAKVRRVQSDKPVLSCRSVGDDDSTKNHGVGRLLMQPQTSVAPYLSASL